MLVEEKGLQRLDHILCLVIGLVQALHLVDLRFFKNEHILRKLELPLLTISLALLKLKAE